MVVAVVHAADADAAAVGFPLDVSIEKLAVLEESAGRPDWHLATPHRIETVPLSFAQLI